MFWPRGVLRATQGHVQPFCKGHDPCLSSRNHIITAVLFQEEVKPWWCGYGTSTLLLGCCPCRTPTWNNAKSWWLKQKRCVGCKQNILKCNGRWYKLQRSCTIKKLVLWTLPEKFLTLTNGSPLSFHIPPKSNERKKSSGLFLQSSLIRVLLSSFYLKYDFVHHRVVQWS